MKVVSFSLFKYQLPLSYFMEKREGLLIKLEDEKGQIAWGETAPLPGYSKESFNQALTQLQETKALLLGKEFTSLPSFLSSLFPSVSFGLQSALSHLLDPVETKTFSLSGLLQGTSDQVLQKATLLKAQGFKSAKLKVKNLPLSEAIELAKELKKDFLLRIDANCAWSLQEGLDFLKHFGKEDFDYFEEPLKNPNDLKEFPSYFALDESLQPQDLGHLMDLPLLKAFVLKPSFLGSLHPESRLIQEAKRRNVQIVLSSFYESGVGILQIAALAARLHITAPLGVDTYTFLKEDVLAKRLDFSRGKIQSIPSIPNFKLLQIL